ncbi:hypothetical protein FXN61_10310 [Lentzea sp. PSKA42]|uniref:Uncharacterized protein n=1 Tax=Lentzea indica TaxID=2604800 RepID=A0ABX1FE35_9PSEU|nr:hypothetical protein [Lentzea indica]NKE57204.1 hypothetical protein [Lentzea indica]
MFPAPPPSAQSVNRGTPFTHCAAGASIWFVALVTVYVVAGVRTGAGLGQLGIALAIGAVLWAPTTVITWLMLMKVRLQPWVLIFVTLPVYLVVWMLVSGIMGALGNVFRLLVT